jgi:hypothetical protein
MKLTKTAFASAAVVVAIVALSLVAGSSVLAAPPDKDVIVVNTPAQPVPVTGTVNVTGGTTVSGTVNAVQSGQWTVSVVPGELLYYSPGFTVIGDAASVDHGPFDLSDLGKLRVIARAVNNNGGDIRFTVFAWDPDSVKRIVLDEFTLNEARLSRFYDAAPPSVLVRVTNGAGGAANYQVVVIGR